MITPIELPYAYDALEPYYDKETMKIHYETLYKGYVTNLNKTEEEMETARQKNNYENIKCMEKNLSYNGSGVILHELFFTNMINAGFGGNASPSLASQINNDFGDFEKFKAQFNAASTNIEAARMGNPCMETKIS